MALGMQNLTGQKCFVELLHKFGHCMPDSLTCDILTANAGSAIEKSKISSLLPFSRTPLYRAQVEYTDGRNYIYRDDV